MKKDPLFFHFVYQNKLSWKHMLLLLSRFVSDSVRPHRRQPTRLRRPWDSPGKNTGVGCHFLLQCMKVKSESEVAQSCPTRSDPMDCSPPGSVVHGIFQARVLEWGAMAFSHEKKGTWGGVGGARSNPVTPPPEPLGQPRGTGWGGPGGKRDTHQRRCHQVWGRVAGRPRPGTEAWRGCRQGRGGMKTSMFP